MKNLQEATEHIGELKGSLLALETLVGALLSGLPAAVRSDLLRAFEGQAEVARTELLHTAISEHTLSAFEREVQRMAQRIRPG